MQQRCDAAREGAAHEASVPVDALSPRGREIAALVAAELTNAGIAQRLSLTPGTAADHVEHIMRVLGVRSRVAVAVWAVKNGLY
jgi:DNA-binding CsgD family transcriptional regulator